MRCLCLLLLAVGAGCATPPAPPARVSLTHGGGFTGMVRGCTVDAGGGVRGWEQFPGAAADTLWRAQLRAARVAPSIRACARAGLAWSQRQTGNLTTSLVYAGADTTWVRSWAGPSLPPSTPAAVADRVEWLQAICSEARAGSQAAPGPAAPGPAAQRSAASGGSE